MRNYFFSWVIVFGFFTTSAAKGEEEITSHRHSLTFDYNSWFQTLTIGNQSSSYESQSQIYGFGLNYLFSTYYSKLGWGVEAGAMQAYGVAGNSTSTTLYYSQRAPLQIYRLGARVFSRLSSKFDLGSTAMVLFGAQTWPDDKGYSVQINASQVIGILIDSHWNISDNWEIIQGVGTFLGSRSMTWRLGASYIF